MVGDGSLLTTKAPLWTEANLERCRAAFNDNPLETPGKYVEKLEAQLSKEAPEVKLVMAELHWILCLFPSNMGGSAKVALIGQIWSWSGLRLDTEQAALDPQTLAGLGSGGPGFLAHRWRELRFLINACVAFKKLSSVERRAVSIDPNGFVNWLESIPDEGDRQLRHMLPHLLFPDHFERIASIRDMRRVLMKLGDFNWDQVRALSRPAIYSELQRIRQVLEAKAAGPIDFYEPHIEVLWKERQFSPEDAETFLEEQLDRYAEPTQKIASFITKPLGPVLALERERVAVRLWLPNVELRELTGVRVVRRYLVGESRNSNLPDPLGVNYAAINVQVDGEAALERLIAAITDDGLPEVEEAEVVMQADLPLNQILFGPPGTGKTFETVTRALRVVDREFFDMNKDNRKALKVKFDELSRKGIIGFVTFHQSFSYEDFVEGIRAEIENGAVKYAVKDGIFKTICHPSRAR